MWSRPACLRLAYQYQPPERRSRRFYRITEAGEAERERLAEDVGMRLERIARSISAIRHEVL